MKQTINSNRLKEQQESISIREKISALNAPEVLGAFVLFICSFFTVLSVQNEGFLLKELLIADAVVALILLVAFLGKSKQ